MSAIAGLLFAGHAGAEVLSHRLDTLSVAGERVIGAQILQGELRVKTPRGWLRRR
ncbi:MAG TPA: hypothetical protein VJT77_06475 [Burkholderiales bacterium]|nr:hypothetical protein [Burkholderiales bacterium]